MKLFTQKINLTAILTRCISQWQRINVCTGILVYATLTSLWIFMEVKFISVFHLSTLDTTDINDSYSIHHTVELEKEKQKWILSIYQRDGPHWHEQHKLYKAITRLFPGRGRGGGGNDSELLFYCYFSTSLEIYLSSEIWL